MVSEEPETYDRRQLMLDAITTWRESIREHRQAFMYAWAPWFNVGRDASNEADGTNGPPVSDDEQDASDHDSSDNEADDPTQPSAVVLQDKQLHRIWNRIDAMDWTIVMSIWIALFIGAVLITIYVYASVFVTKAGVFYVIQLDAWFRTWLISAWSLSERGIFWHCVETWATLSLSLPTYLLGAGGSQATLFRAMRSMGSVTPFAGGVAVYSHDAVSTALLNATQRQYLNGYLVSEQCERFSNVIFPEERHGQVNEIYVLALGEIDRPCQEHSYLLDRVSHTDDNRTASGLSNMFDHGCPLLKEPAHLVDAKDNVIAAERSDIERSVARNLWNRVFFQTPSKQLEIALVSYFDLADQCRRGRIASWLTGGTTKEYRLNDVESIRTVALEAASKSKIGLAVTTVAKEKRGLSLTDANEVLATLVDHLLNGMLSTGHLVISSLDRIQSQPARFKPLWHKDPRAFLIENARLDPAVASVTTVLAEDQDFNVAFGSGTKSVRLQRGSTVQLVISEANTDPAVFGGARSRDFDTNRSAAEIAKILAWTGPLSSVLDNSDQATRSCLGYEQSLKIAQKIVNRFEEIDFDDVDVDRNAQESQRIETAQQLPATAFLNNEVALGLWAAMCASVAGFFLLSGDGVVLQWYACWNVAQFAWAISRLLNSDTAAHCIVLTGVAWYMMGLVVVKYRWDNIKVKWNEQKFDPTLLPPMALRFAVVVCWFSTHVIILYVQRKRRLFFANEADWQDDDLCLGLETWLAGRSAPGELRYLLATLLSGDTAAMKVAITFSVPAMALANVSFWYFWYKERDANARYWMRLGFFSSLMGVVNIVWPHMFNFSVEFWPLMRSLADIFLFTPGIIVAAVCVNERVKLGPKPRKQKNPISLKAWRRSAKIVVVIVFALLAVSSGLFYFIVNATYGSDVCISADYKNHDQYCREGSIELGKVDPHTRLVYQLIHNFGNSRRDKPPEVHPPKYRYGSRKLVKLPGDIYVPTWDEDFPHDSTFERLKYAIFDYLRWPGPHPNEDLVDPFPDPTRAAQILNTVTKEDLEPLELVEYGTLSSDADLEHFTFSGLAAHTVERVEPLDSSGVAFLSNFSWMAGLAVRQGFEKYGATAYFNAGGGLLKIYWDHGPEGNKDVHPGDANWDHAKWVFRCSVLVGVTVRDHLVGVHFMASNFLSTSAVRNLGPDHPIRRMLKPHTFGAASINKAATLTLVSENSFVHRGTALTTEAMKEALSASVNSIMFQTAEEHLESTKMAGVSEKLYPWGHDLLRFTAIVRDFVEAYIHVYYADDDAVAADEELSEFWHDLWRDPTACFATGNLTRDRVVDTLAHFIVFVTGIHNHVGNVADYIKDPRFVSAKIRPVYVVADIQATFQVLNIGLATSKKMPRLLSNFNHVLLKDEHLETTTNIFQEFQQKLLKFKIAVEDANKLRKYPCNAFNPDKMVSSVSI